MSIELVASVIALLAARMSLGAGIGYRVFCVDHEARVLARAVTLTA